MEQVNQRIFVRYRKKWRNRMDFLCRSSCASHFIAHVWHFSSHKNFGKSRL